jgi:polysaccharide export outer membrane protein
LVAQVKSAVKSEKKNKKIIYEYKIAPRDRLKIVVFNHPELSTVNVSSNDITKQASGIVVSPKGTINLPLIGEVKVSGFTQQQASEFLKNRFKKYLKKPYVSVEVLNKRIYIIGEVKVPGVVPLFSDSMSLIEALAQSGGMTEYAQRDKIMILRGDLHNPEIININLTNLESVKMSNLMLKPNDIVYVTPNKVRARNIGINAVMPGVDLIGRILSSFANIKYLSE